MPLDRVGTGVADDSRRESRVNRSAASGVLPILRAFVRPSRHPDSVSFTPGAIGHALDLGLGPVLAHVATNGGVPCGPVADRIRAADLTARALCAARYDTLSEVLTVARSRGCRVVLLKGAATALRYYPAPHMRTTGDIDIFVAPDEQRSLEAGLLERGFVQHSGQPATAFVGWHHGVPLHDVRRGIWVDVHTKAYPPPCPPGLDTVFSRENIVSQLSRIDVRSHVAYAMCDELQLAYSGVRWAEEFALRGVYSLLDAALLISTRAASLDWDRVVGTLGRSWAASALHLLLAYLHQMNLAPVPAAVLDTLAAVDRHLSRTSIGVLHRIVTTYVMEGRQFGLAFTSEGHLRIAWSSLLGPRSPAVNLLSVPYHLACPPGHPDRFSPLYAIRRVGAFSRRAWAAVGQGTLGARHSSGSVLAG